MIDQGSNQEQFLGDIQINSMSRRTATWLVKTFDKPCKVKIEAIGEYKVPDLQYAIIEESLNPILVIDLHGNKQATIGEVVEFKAELKGWADELQKSRLSRDISWRWYWNNSVYHTRQGGTWNSIQGKAGTAGINSIVVEAYVYMGPEVRRWEKLAEARCVLEVKQPPSPTATLSIQGLQRIKVGEKVDLAALISGSNVPLSDLYCKWFVDNKEQGTGHRISLIGDRPGTRLVAAELWMKRQTQDLRLSRATQQVTIEGENQA